MFIRQCGLETLSDRRQNHSRTFDKSLTKYQRTDALIPPTRLAMHGRELLNSNSISLLPFRTERLRKSPIPFKQQVLLMVLLFVIYFFLYPFSSAIYSSIYLCGTLCAMQVGLNGDVSVGVCVCTIVGCTFVSKVECDLCGYVRGGVFFLFFRALPF